MAFTKLSLNAAGASPGDRPAPACESDIWAIFRALRDARSVFGLRPGHMQTLQAMLSFLKPGQGETVFASNHSICERVGGIDERTLRRHINRFVELGFITRHDSTNRKRYRVRASGGESISYGLSLAPMLRRAGELLELAQAMEDERRDKIFLRKRILSRLALLEENDAENAFLIAARKQLRRKLSIVQHRELLAAAEAECEALSTPVDLPEPTQLSVNDGQTVRHQSRSDKEKKDKKEPEPKGRLLPRSLAAVCDQATALSTKALRSWQDIEDHARTLAPMMGIPPQVFEKAKKERGSEKASSAIFLMLENDRKIKNFHAYFHSLTLGSRQESFDPAKLVKRMSVSQAVSA